MFLLNILAFLKKNMCQSKVKLVQPKKKEEKKSNCEKAQPGRAPAPPGRREPHPAVGIQ